MAEHHFEFNNMNPGATILRRLDPIVIEKPRAPMHVHTYGGETPFFRGLTEGRLMATKCLNDKCDPSGKEGYYHLPPRIHCPDCLEKMEWEDITELARQKAKIHTHITIEHPGVASSDITCDGNDVLNAGRSLICWAMVPARAGQYAVEVEVIAWDNDGRRTGSTDPVHYFGAQ